jgi:hypothetical protein
MKKLLLITGLVLSFSSFCQTGYKYYFFTVRPTGNAKVELTGLYPETDSLLLEKIEVNRKGDTTYVFKKFDNYSTAFDALSAAGLEYVEFRSLPAIGGFTKMLVGDVRVDWIIWRRRL